MAKKITCYIVAVDRASDVSRLINRAIRTTLLSKKPVYIEIPTNLAGAPCMRPGPISAVIDLAPTNPAVLAVIIGKAASYLYGKLKPAILVGPKLRHAGPEAKKALLKLAEAIGYIIAV